MIVDNQHRTASDIGLDGWWMIRCLRTNDDIVDTWRLFDDIFVDDVSMHPGDWMIFYNLDIHVECCYECSRDEVSTDCCHRVSCSGMTFDVSLNYPGGWMICHNLGIHVESCYGRSHGGGADVVLVQKTRCTNRRRTWAAWCWKFLASDTMWMMSMYNMIKWIWYVPEVLVTRTWREHPSSYK